MAEQQTVTLTKKDLDALIRGAVSAAIGAVGAIDERRVRDAELKRAKERQARADAEAARPPKRTDITRDEHNKAAPLFRAGSHVKVKVHRPIRMRCFREGDDLGAPPRMGPVAADEVVTVPISADAVFDGQGSRDMAHHMLRGMFEVHKD